MELKKKRCECEYWPWFQGVNISKVSLYFMLTCYPLLHVASFIAFGINNHLFQKKKDKKSLYVHCHLMLFSSLIVSGADQPVIVRDPQAGPDG